MVFYLKNVLYANEDSISFKSLIQWRWRVRISRKICDDVIKPETDDDDDGVKIFVGEVVAEMSGPLSDGQSHVRPHANEVHDTFAVKIRFQVPHEHRRSALGQPWGHSTHVVSVRQRKVPVVWVRNFAFRVV